MKKFDIVCPIRKRILIEEWQKQQKNTEHYRTY